MEGEVLVSRHTENGDAGYQIHGRETANWFVMKDLKFTGAQWADMPLHQKHL